MTSQLITKLESYSYNKLITAQLSVPNGDFTINLEQWFSTFFNSRHTKVQKNFGCTLIPKKIANLTKRGFFPKKRIGKVRKKNLAAHLEGARGTPVEKHCSRHCKWYLR
jgi:hypothetical protein